MTDLIPLNTENLNPLEVFKPETVTDILAKINTQAEQFINDSTALDLTKAIDRDVIKSFAFKITKSKTAIDGMGKELVSEWKTKSAAVDAERKRVRDTLDALSEKVRQPVTNWEVREDQRKEEHLRRIQAMKNCADFTGLADPTMDELGAGLGTLNKLYTVVFDGGEYDWQEYAEQAKAAFEATANSLNASLAARKQYDEDQAELKRLRDEKAERDRVDAERVQNEKKETARVDAIKNRIMSMKTGQTNVSDIQNLDTLIVMLDKFEKEAFDYKEFAEEAFAALDKFEIEVFDYQEFADEAFAVRGELIETIRARKEVLEQKRRDDIAAEVTRKAEAEKQAEEADRLKRERTTQHRGKVHKAIQAALIEKAGLSEEKSYDVVMALKSDAIPHVKIEY